MLNFTDLKPISKLQERAFAQVDIASLVFFRIAFGLLMIRHVSQYFTNGWIRTYWIEPRFLFKYYGFSWVEPWPGNGLYIHCAILGVLALLIALGFLYRLATPLFFLGYTYTFLLDESRWVNHTYLICLFSFLLIFIPAHRALSVDARLRPRLRSRTTRAWVIWLLRLQMGVVYFFAGVAKLSPDWLHGEPMRTWLASKESGPLLDRFFHEEWFAYVASYAALCFDLLIVPFLLWRRTRIAAFCVAVAFHLFNARSFGIGVFPWLAIAATTMFLPADWPRRLKSLFHRANVATPTQPAALPSRQRQAMVLGFVAIYAAIQMCLPLRHFFYRGGIEWYNSEHRFSWRMMLMFQSTLSFFYVTDPNNGEIFEASPFDFLDEEQVNRMSWRPDMVLQFAHYLAKEMPRSGPKPLRVEARLFVSLNGRKPTLILDPNVDLASESRTFGRPRWLREIHDPLPPPNKRSSEEAFTSLFDTFQ